MMPKSVHDMKGHLFIFNKILQAKSFLGLPAMTRLERQIYKKILLSLPWEEALEIFEYGSGHSTIYFAKFLKREGIPFHIQAIDNSRLWFERVQRLVKMNHLDKEVRLQLFEFPVFWDKPGWNWRVAPESGQFAPSADAEKEYIHCPLTLNKKFDLIVVDGRFRRRCLEVASRCIRPEGIVFLHDAEKEKYHSALPLYKYAKFLDSGPYYPFEPVHHRMWIGSLANPDIMNLGEATGASSRTFPNLVHCQINF